MADKDFHERMSDTGSKSQKHSMRNRTLVVYTVGVVVSLLYLLVVKRSQYVVPQPMFSSQQYGTRQHSTSTLSTTGKVHNQSNTEKLDHGSPKSTTTISKNNSVNVKGLQSDTETSTSYTVSSSSSSTSNQETNSPSDSTSSTEYSSTIDNSTKSLSNNTSSTKSPSSTNTGNSSTDHQSSTNNDTEQHSANNNLNTQDSPNKNTPEQDSPNENDNKKDSPNDNDNEQVSPQDNADDNKSPNDNNDNAQDSALKAPETTTPVMSLEDRFKTLLRHTANNDGLIYLSSVDFAYLPMAINLYKTSYKRLGITNYLIVCSDDKAHQTLKEQSINSFKYLGDKSSDTPVIYGTKEFRRKTHLKTKIILDALLLGLTVIIVDVDIIFFKDPVPYLNCRECDIQIQNDVSEGNSGFYMARPTDPAIKLHRTAWDKAQTTGESVSNQKLLDRATESMQRAGQLKYKILDSHLFPSGHVYFEYKIRMLYTDNPPNNEVILHNNWIVSMEAKRYRFKELLWWYVDGGYYSDPARKYLAYENPRDFGTASTQRQETDALISAFIISHLLNRTLILPTFTCHNCKYGACKVSSHKCTFNTHYMVATFDAVMVDNYREHVFLEHPLVPDLYKVPSMVNVIKSSDDNAQYPSEMRILFPTDATNGPSADEIIRWFGENTEPVLRFHSMYGILGKLRTEEVFSKIKKAINEHTDYRQYQL